MRRVAVRRGRGVTPAHQDVGAGGAVVDVDARPRIGAPHQVESVARISDGAAVGAQDGSKESLLPAVEAEAAVWLTRTFVPATRS